jgi:hypothetical protein
MGSGGVGSDGFVDGLMVHQMGERGGGRDGREGKKERWRFFITYIEYLINWYFDMRT